MAEFIVRCRLCKKGIFGMNHNQLQRNLVEHLVLRHGIDPGRAGDIVRTWVGA